jgi:hypothetical protein
MYKPKKLTKRYEVEGNDCMIYITVKVRKQRNDNWLCAVKTEVVGSYYNTEVPERGSFIIKDGMRKKDVIRGIKDISLSCPISKKDL